MERRVVVGLSLFFVLMFSAIIVATPPAGNYTIGTSWCESSLSGIRCILMKVEELGLAPYACSSGCTGYGTGQNCKAAPGGYACAPRASYITGVGGVIGTTSGGKYICV